jgi:hypothetical protein
VSNDDALGYEVAGYNEKNIYANETAWQQVCKNVKNYDGRYRDGSKSIYVFTIGDLRFPVSHLGYAV